MQSENAFLFDEVKSRMPEFNFQIFCHDADTSDESFLDRLYEAGCDDATVFFKDGYVCLDFARECECAEQAVVTAIRDYQAAGIGGTVIRIEPEDLASLSEIAKRVGVTRASLQKYARGHSKIGSDFPRPAANISQPRRELYSTAEVMRWMVARNRIGLPPESLELADTIERSNRALLIAKSSRDQTVSRLVAQLSKSQSKSTRATT
ncbi:MAG: hypothetical protein R3212_10270 [Xanthomonadales bacterium]|nr:hypothetical protein [Xanthomonadales bacterium]